jgi:Mg2+-importing ATPase
MQNELESRHEHNQLFSSLTSSLSGLSSQQASAALERYGSNSLSPITRYPRLRLLASQFKSPISILLGVAALISAVVGERFDGAVIVGILIASSALGYWQELRAQSAVEILLKRSNLGVGYLGDGINDAAALRAGDVGIPVDSAADVTKEAADIVLLSLIT